MGKDFCTTNFLQADHKFHKHILFANTIRSSKLDEYEILPIILLLKKKANYITINYTI